MKDDLTNKIIGSITVEGGFPLVVKVSVPCLKSFLPFLISLLLQSMSYGELQESLPFLARRATENKAVLEGRGGAVAERVRLGREIRRRLLPFTS
jgi:proline dehydrogenase